MKKIYLLLTSLVLTHMLSAQAPFGFSEKYGFGPLQYPAQPNASITDVIEFKNNFYVGIGSDSGYVYKSATGDPGSYQRVYQDPFVRWTNNFETTNDGAMGGYMFMAADISTSYGSPKVERSADGVAWNKYFQLPNFASVTSIKTFKGLDAVDSVYIAYHESSTGSFVLRNSVDAMDPMNGGGTWDTVASFYNEFGTYSKITASVVFNGKLYYALDNNTLYETSDGRSVTENTDFANQMGASSGLFNNNVMSMAVHNSELYLGTYNNSSGYEVWKTADGITFTNLLSSTGSLLERVVNMKSAGGKLWFIVHNLFSHTFQVRSYDGTTFVTENSDEFGQSDLNVDSYSALGLFDNHLYVGVTHLMSAARLADPANNTFVLLGNTTGGQLWRTCLVGAFPNVSVTSPNPVYKCSGSTTPVTMTATTDAVSYQWSTGATTLSTSTPDTGHFYITGVAANGCRYSDEQTIHSHPVSVAPHFDAEYMDVTSTNVCMGDTSIRVYAYDANNPDNGLVVSSGDMGFTTPGTEAFNSSRDITIELWFKPFYNTVGPIISESDTSLAGPFGIISMMRLESNGDVLIALHGSSTNEILLGNVASSYNAWHHIVLRYSNGTGDFDGMLDGVPATGDTRLRSIPQDVGGGDCYKICMKSYVEANLSMPYNSDGIVRDIRIWNSVRTNQELIDNMYGLPAGSYPTLVYHYKANEPAASTTITDYSGNGYDTLVAGYFVNATPVSWVASPTLIDLGSNYAQFHPTIETTYHAYYTDGNGCASDTGSFDAIVPYIDIDNFYDPGHFASCGGDPVFVIPVSNVGLNMTTWSSPSMGSITTYSTAVAPPSAEYLVVRDTIWGYCPLVDSVLITAGPVFESLLGNPPPVNGCEGTDVVLDLMASGGTAPYTFVWEDYLMQHDTTTVDTLVYLMPAFTSTVNITATDAVGCYFTAILTTSPTSSTDLHGHVSTPPPAVNVDNGYVYVFKHQPGSAGLDTMGFTSLDANGDYLFTPLTAGDYLIKVLADTTDFPLGVPTYYGDVFQWDSSIVYTHGCFQTDTADIELVVMDGSTGTGTASISGYILEGDSFGAARFGSGNHPLIPCVPGGPLKGIDVKLGKNPGGGIQARVMTDSVGFYEFEGIPDGGYRIYVDIPNLPMDSTREITVASGDSSIQNNYFADSASIYINPDTVVPVGIYASAKKYENGFEIYPNPAHGNLYLSYNLKQSDYVSFEICNAMGQLIRQEPLRKHPEGKNIFVFNTDQLNLQSGVYFISILTDNKKYTQRLVVID